jgi:hypothetical protein
LPDHAPDQAVALLDEALAQVERGDYGWRQISMNRARALRRKGHLAAAEDVHHTVRFIDICHSKPRCKQQ